MGRAHFVWNDSIVTCRASGVGHRASISSSEEVDYVREESLRLGRIELEGVDQLHQVIARQKAEYDDLVRKLHLAMQKAHTLLRDVRR